MKVSDVQFLQCPTCCSDFALYPIQMEGERVVSGVLSCVGCTISFPIMNEVYHFLSKEESAALLSPNEREAAEALLQGAKQDIQNHSGKQQLQVSANWDYQFSDAFKVRQQDLAREEGFWGSRAFHLFSCLSSDDLRRQSRGDLLRWIRP